MIGGTGSDFKLQSLFNKVARLTGRSKPVVAYLDAANGNQHLYTDKLESAFRQAFPKGEFMRLDLGADGSSSQNAADVLAKADMIYMDGGNLESLVATLNCHNIKPHLQAAFQRGACVGGMSAGGLVLGQYAVNRTSDRRYELTQGLDLIKGTALAAHIDRPEERMHRLSVLDYAYSEIPTRSAFGVGANHALLIDDPDRPHPVVIQGVEENTQDNAILFTDNRTGNNIDPITAPSWSVRSMII